MKTTSIGFIGAGNMASALIGGLSGKDAMQIFVSDPSQEKVDSLVADFGVTGLTDNQSLVNQCDVVVLAVKPQVVKSVLQALKFEPNGLILSVAAGIRCKSISDWTHQQSAIVRSMPNTPALVKCGATGLYANSFVTPQQRQLAETIMSAVGIALWVDAESQLDAVTAVSGSGPAYFFYMMEAIEAAGIELGLSAQTSRQLTLQTALGAAKLAQSSSESAAELRFRVTSPGGTTEAAINHLQQSKGFDTIKQAVMAAHERSKQLAEQMADD